MYISNELEEAIKQEFGIKELSYMGNGKNCFDEHILVFKTNYSYYLAVYPKYNNIYSIHIVTRDPIYNRYFRKNFNDVYLSIKNNNTYLDGKCKLKIEGVAFDFLEDFLIAKLEEQYDKR